MATPGSSNPVGNTSVAPTAAQFLADYPKFDTSQDTDTNALQISPESIQYWLNMAVLLLNQSRFGTMYYMACELFIAHNVALEAWAEQGGDQTPPGISKGMIAGSSSGDVTVTYNNLAVLELDAGHWNNTVYGTRFIKLCRLVSAGPLQVGGGCLGGPAAWAGIPIFNFPNPSGF